MLWFVNEVLTPDFLISFTLIVSPFNQEDISPLYDSFLLISKLKNELICALDDYKFLLELNSVEIRSSTSIFRIKCLSK